MDKKLLFSLKLSLILGLFFLALPASAITPATLDVFTIDNPVIAPEDTSGLLAKSASIDLEFSGPVDIDMYLRNSSDVAIKHFYNVAASSTFSRVWNGKDSSNNFVADGTYTVQVVYTSASTTATDTSKTIIVDNDVPVVGAITVTPSRIVGSTTYIGVSSDLSVDVSDAGTGIRDCEFGYDNGTVSYWGSTVTSCTLNDVDTSDQMITKIIVQAYDNFQHSQSGDQAVTVDATAPVTTISAESGSAPYSFGTPTTNSVVVTLDSVDSESGLDKIYYSTDDGANYTVYAGPFTLTTPGTYLLKVYGIDYVGNQEVAQGGEVKIEAPSSGSHSSGFAPGWGPNGSVNLVLGQVLGTSTEKISSQVRDRSNLTPVEKRLRLLKKRKNHFAIKIYELKHPQASQVLGTKAPTAGTGIVDPVTGEEIPSTSTASSSPAKKPFWKFW